MTTPKEIADWLFRDRESGAIVIGQLPNRALYVAGGAWLARLITPAGAVSDAFGWLFSGALAWWAIDEMLRGVNPWRRFLGAFVLAAVILGRLL